MSVCDWYCKNCGKFKERCVCEKTERVSDSLNGLVGCEVDGFYYPELGEELGNHQPNLEFKLDSGEWVESGLKRGRLRQNFVGFYRVRITANDKITCEKGE